MGIGSCSQPSAVYRLNDAADQLQHLYIASGSSVVEYASLRGVESNQPYDKISPKAAYSNLDSDSAIPSSPGGGKPKVLIMIDMRLASTFQPPLDKLGIDFDTT